MVGAFIFLAFAAGVFLRRAWKVKSREGQARGERRPIEPMPRRR